MCSLKEELEYSSINKNDVITVLLTNFKIVAAQRYTMFFQVVKLLY